MKASLSILFAIFLLTTYVGKTTTTPSATSEPAIVITQPVLEEVSVPLLIGGKQYKGYLGDRVEYESQGIIVRGFPGDPTFCNTEDIDRLIIVGLWVDPDDPESINNLENIQLLYNLKELRITGKNLNKIDFTPISSLISLESLYIKGENMNMVDFSPISSLINLEKLEIEGNITRLPDMKKLERLKTVDIKRGALESLEGLGGIGIEKIILYTHKSDNTTLRINDINNMPELRIFGFEGGKIDLYGINRFTLLEILDLRDCEPFNLEGIGYLVNLQDISINITSPTPSIEFIKNLKKLKYIMLYGNRHLYPYGFPSEYTTEILESEATQILDVSPLAVLIKPPDIIFRDFSIRNFIIKNISALDALENGKIELIGSRLYDVWGSQTSFQFSESQIVVIILYL